MCPVLAKREAFKPEQHSIEDCLLELRKYGHPKITAHKDGWYSRIEVFVTGDGVEFDVQSDWRMPEPKAAVNQCYERLMEAMRQIKET